MSAPSKVGRPESVTNREIMLALERATNVEPQTVEKIVEIMKRERIGHEYSGASAQRVGFLVRRMYEARLMTRGYQDVRQDGRTKRGRGHPPVVWGLANGADLRKLVGERCLVRGVDRGASLDAGEISLDDLLAELEGFAGGAVDGANGIAGAAIQDAVGPEEGPGGA